MHLVLFVTVSCMQGVHLKSLKSQENVLGFFGLFDRAACEVVPPTVEPGSSLECQGIFQKLVSCFIQSGFFKSFFTEISHSIKCVHSSNPVCFLYSQGYATSL